MRALHLLSGSFRHLYRLTPAHPYHTRVLSTCASMSTSAGAGAGAGAGPSADAVPPAPGVEGTTPDSGKPESFLLIYNVAKRTNVGNIVRSACAFGVKEVLVVGRREVKGFGAQGTMKHMRFSRHNTLKDAVQYLHEERGCRLCGVEILPQAKPVNSHPFSGNTCFMLGNEGHGLNERQIEMCDEFVYIPHYGNGTASLNVTVAGSIILHHFGVWAGYTERPRDDTEEAKFAVDALPDPRTRTRTREELALRAARAKLKQGSRLDQGQLDSDAGEAAQAASSLFHADSSSSSDGEDAA